jgi:hypothetical protein
MSEGPTRATAVSKGAKAALEGEAEAPADALHSEQPVLFRTKARPPHAAGEREAG